MLSRIGNIFHGVGLKDGVDANVTQPTDKKSVIDQKIKLIAKVILWAAIGAVCSLLPGLCMVGKPGLYWNMTVLGKEVWGKLVPPGISMLIGASGVVLIRYSHWYKNPNAGIFEI